MLPAPRPPHPATYSKRDVFLNSLGSFVLLPKGLWFLEGACNKEFAPILVGKLTIRYKAAAVAL